MKLLLTIWISTILTQEVFSNTLVRRPRHTLNKPTSSVHTEYEATYEQKGRLGNGSYSSVSGKQEVVHDNCGDNWNAFADKCASLIKDLVASLGNAVSSKPGDATNLQLRIRNTFRHFDSTDNCTCLNNTKDALSSLFNNITISTAQPVAISGAGGLHQSSKCGNGQSCTNGKNMIISAQQSNGYDSQQSAKICEGESCSENTDDQEKALHRHPKLLQQQVSQPNLDFALEIDPESADTSKESLTNNSRRGAKYPAVTAKDPVQLSVNSETTAGGSKPSSSVSPASTHSKKILLPHVVTPQSILVPTEAVGSPTGAVIPNSQAVPEKLQTNSPEWDQVSTSQKNSVNLALPIVHPAKNNDIVKSDISVIPTPALSSASRISSPEGSQSVLNNPNDAGNNDDEYRAGSAQIPAVTSDIIPSLPVPLKPISDIAQDNQSPVEAISDSKKTPVLKLAVLKMKPVKSAVVQPLITSTDSERKNLSGSSQTPVEAIQPAREPVKEIATKPQITATQNEGENDAGSTSVVIPVVPKMKPVNGALDKSEIPSTSGQGYRATNNDVSTGIAIATPEVSGSQPLIALVNGDGNSDSGSNQTPVVTPVVPLPKAKKMEGVITNPETISTNGEEDCGDEATTGKDIGSNQTPVVTPVLPLPKAKKMEGVITNPETISTNGEEDCGDEATTGKDIGSNRTPVVTPVVPLPKAKKMEGVITNPETISTNGEEDCDDEATTGKDIGSNQTPVVTPVVPLPKAKKMEGVITNPETISTNDEDCGDEATTGKDVGSNRTPVVTPVVPLPKAKKMEGVITNPETISTNGEEDCDDEDTPGKDAVSNESPVLTPIVTKVKPVNGVQPQIMSSISGGNTDESTGGGTSESIQAPVITPVVSIVEPVNSIGAEPQHTSSDDTKLFKAQQTLKVLPAIAKAKEEGEECDDDESTAANVSNQTPVITPVVSKGEPAEPQTTSTNSEGDAASGMNSGFHQTAPVTPAVVEPQISASKGGVFIEANNAGSDQAPIATPILENMTPINEAVVNGEDCEDDDGVGGTGSGLNQTPVVTPVVPLPKAEKVKNAKAETISANGEEVCDDEDTTGKGDGSNQAPVVTPIVSEVKPVEDTVAESQITTSDGGRPPATNYVESNPASIDTPVESVMPPNYGAATLPQIISKYSDVGATDDCSESDKGTVVQAVTSSFQDPSIMFSEKRTKNIAPNPESSLVTPTMPVSNSNDSEMPVTIEADGSIQEAQLPEDHPMSSTDPNVIPGLITKRPQDELLAQKDPSSVIPIINSDSNLPESSGPVSNVGTVNPSPIYVPLPTAPSSTPSSNSAVINKNPEQATIDEKVMPGVPLTTQHDTNGADQSISISEEIPVPSAAKRSRVSSKTATLITTEKADNEGNRNVFIVTPVPVNLHENDPIVVTGKHETQTSSGLMGTPNVKHTKRPVASKPPESFTADVKDDENQSLVTSIYTLPVKSILEKSKPESQSLQLGADSSNMGVAVDPQIADSRPEIMYTTPMPPQPAKLIPVAPIVLKDPKSNAVKSEEPLGFGNPLPQQHPLLSKLNNKKSAVNQPLQPVEIEEQLTKPDPHDNDHSLSPPGVTSLNSGSISGGESQLAATPPQSGKPVVPVGEITEEDDLTKPTTFQTTSTDSTPPLHNIQSPPPLKIAAPVTQPSSLLQDSDETAHNTPTTSPRTIGSKHTDDDDDDDDEDCCSCESCTEEEMTNPKQYKEIACKDLEEARKELKAIFDKIKKKLKCGRKAPQKIITS